MKLLVLRNQVIFFVFLSCFIVTSCKKGFLNEKPNTSIIQPVTLTDFQNLLDNALVLNVTSALPHISSDEYFIVSDQVYQALNTQTQKNAYIWEKDFFGGETNVASWNTPYSGIFYANNVIDKLPSIERNSSNKDAWENLMGSALFMR